MAQAEQVTSAPPARRRKRGFWPNLLTSLFTKKPLGTIGLVLVLALFITGIFAPLIAPDNYNDPHVEDRLQPPSGRYPLGTDNLGRDVLSRVIWGARLSMIVGVCATLLHTVISTVLGMSSAYIGGKFDLIFQRFIDAYTCFPDLVLLITLMAIFGPGLLQILLVLGVSAGLQGVRQKRAIVFMIKENQYIHASETLGAGTWSIMMRHILPNILPFIITTFTLRMGAVIMAEASLSFLGLGLPPPMPSWGGMISGPGRVFLVRAPWMLFWPGLALTASIFGINMLGDALRDLLDPRLRGGTGSYRLDKAEKSRAKVLKNYPAA